MSTAQIADLVERVCMPLLVAFAAGVLVGEWSTERNAEAALIQARQTVRAARVELVHLQTACEPLLSLPPQSTPEILPADEAGDTSLQRPLPLRVVPPGLWASAGAKP